MTEVVINEMAMSRLKLSDEAVGWLWENGYENTAEAAEENEPIDRDDEGLVNVVDTLGNAAGFACRLSIIEVPDQVEWHVGTRAGREVVVEDHRTWS